MFHSTIISRGGLIHSTVQLSKTINVPTWGFCSCITDINLLILNQTNFVHFVTEIKKNTDVTGKKLKETKEIVGIITLEDIIEALMDKKIEDEMDSDDENEKKNNNTN